MTWAPKIMIIIGLLLSIGLWYVEISKIYVLLISKKIN